MAYILMTLWFISGVLQQRSEDSTSDILNFPTSRTNFGFPLVSLRSRNRDSTVGPVPELSLTPPFQSLCRAPPRSNVKQKQKNWLHHVLNTSNFFGKPPKNFVHEKCSKLFLLLTFVSFRKLLSRILFRVVAMVFLQNFARETGARPELTPLRMLERLTAVSAVKCKVKCRRTHERTYRVGLGLGNSGRKFTECFRQFTSVSWRAFHCGLYKYCFL